jgi:hypothetical protein
MHLPDGIMRIDLRAENFIRSSLWLVLVVDTPLTQKNTMLTWVGRQIKRLAIS